MKVAKVERLAIICLVVLAWSAPGSLRAQPQGLDNPGARDDASPNTSGDASGTMTGDTADAPGSSESEDGFPGNAGGSSTGVPGAAAASGSVVTVPDDGDESGSWNDGTSPERQDRAQSLYDEANKLVEVASVAAAIGKYKEALSHWDHPKIRYNLAVLLMETGKQVEAYGHIVAALRHGVVALGPANHKRAMTDRRVLQAGLVSLSIRSQQPDVEVSLDGEAVVDTSGQVRSLIRPGEHQLLIRGGGYGTIAAEYPFWPDRHYDITVDPASGIKRYWRGWIPWSVLGTGVVLSSVGGLLHWRAQSNFNEFDDKVIERCRDGCPPGAQPAELESLENRAETQGRFAAALYAVGGVAAVSGIALIIANRPRRVHEDAFHIREAPFDVTVAPAVSRGGVSGISIQATGSF